MIRLFLTGILAAMMAGCGSAKVVSVTDKDGIRDKIRENKKLYQACYDKALKTNKTVAGKIVVQWDITESGKAENGLVKENTTKVDSFAQCVLSKTASIKFPPAPKNQVARVVYPFVFDTK